MCNRTEIGRGERKDMGKKRHHHGGRSSESILDKTIILGALNIRAGERVLDAGCGNGYMAKEFAKRAGATGKIYALDPDAGAISTLQKETAKSTIEAFVGDITRETKLAAASIDLMYVSTVVHGFSGEDMAGFVTEAKRVLKPGGRLAIVEIKKEETPFGPPLHIRLSPEELIAAIGLKNTTQVNIGPYFYLQLFEK